MYVPTKPYLYSDDQVILNSGRLLFNAKNDAILLHAKKAISLSSADSVHINCDVKPGFIVNAPEIHLGLATNNTPEEPLVKGETLKSALDQLLTKLSALAETLKSPTPQAGTLLPSVGAASDLIISIGDEGGKGIRTTIEESLSKTNYTI